MMKTEVKTITDYSGKKRIVIKSGLNVFDVTSKRQAEKLAAEIIKKANMAWKEDEK